MYNGKRYTGKWKVTRGYTFKHSFFKVCKINCSFE